MSDEVICATESPHAVIRCYQLAHETRDLGAVDLLLADDFECVYLDNPETGCPGKREALAGLKQIWETPPEKVRRFEVTYDGDPSVSRDQTRDCWIIDGVRFHLRMDGVSDTMRDGVYTLDQLLTWCVRLEEAPEPHYVIFREEIRPLSSD